jgi:hypothetical protein
MNKKRWYDKDKELAKYLDNLVKIHPDNELKVINGLLEIIRQNNPDILNKFTIPHDIENWHKRWYDNNPIFWLTINSLKYADEKLLKKISDYLEKEIAAY